MQAGMGHLAPQLTFEDERLMTLFCGSVVAEPCCRRYVPRNQSINRAVVAS
jgi:hypothetical protein